LMELKTDLYQVYRNRLTGRHWNYNIWRKSGFQKVGL